MSTPLIEVRNVWKRYGEQVVLERLNLKIEEGAFCAVVGASGCGKTTFLRMLLGEEPPDRGEILLGGKPLRMEPDAERGIVFQRYSVFPHLSVLGNVMLGLELQSAPFSGRLFGGRRRDARRRALDMLEQVGLANAQARYPSELSGGMQQRLALAQSLIARGQAQRVAVSLGEAGAMLVTAQEAWRAQALTVPVQTTIGAGDSFVAGMLWAWLRHEPAVETLRWAVAASAAALLAPGTALCQSADVHRLRPEVQIAPV